jgi:hypothetical protein
MIKKGFHLLAAICGAWGSLAQPNFTRVTSGFTPVAFAETKWVDLDGDGDLDLIQMGTSANYTSETAVYENVAGTFTTRVTSLPGIQWGALAAGDYDNDGDLDILLSGSTDPNMNETLSAIFRNDGNFSFSQQHTFPGMSNSSADWLDADNDGDLDLILTGILGNVWGAFDTFLYENTGTGFTEVTTFDVNCAMCAIDIADGNGDGKVDLMMVGLGFTGVMENQGNMNFVANTSSLFPQLNSGAGRWGDFDRDGDPDILLTGMTDGNMTFSLIYENKNGIFTHREDLPLLPLSVNRTGGTLWFDYNNDGWLDILISGRPAGSNIATQRMYTNQGGTSFQEHYAPSFDPLESLSVDAGDMDNDGDLDLCFLGYYYVTPGSAFPLAGYFRNNLITAPGGSPTTPGPPDEAGFSERGFRRETYLRWNAGSDDDTPSEGLTYNFYLKEGGQRIISPSVDFTNGFLRTANMANGFGRRGFGYNLPEGNLTYAVQSIDGTRAASAFSAERTFFHFNGPEIIFAPIAADNHIHIAWVDHSSIEANFQISRSTDPLSGFAVVGTVPANSVTASDLYPFLTETNYYYRIAGLDGNGHTSPYDSISVMIPNRPTSLSIIAPNAYTVQLGWSDESAHETGYLIERRATGTGLFETVATLPADTEFFEDTGLSPGSQLEYQIHAISANGHLPAIQTLDVQTNFLPVGTTITKTLLEDSFQALSASDFTTHFTDADVGDQLVKVKVVSLTSNGTVNLSGAPLSIGQEISPSQLDLLTFISNPDFAGTTSFSVYPYDGKDYGIVAWAIAFVVEPVNDPPVFTVPATISGQEDGLLAPVLPVLANIPHELSDVLSYSILPTTSSIVSVTLNPVTGEVTLTPLPDAFGSEDFTLTANDGQAVNHTYSQSFTVTIAPVNDAPFLGIIGDILVELEDFETIPPVALVVSDVDNTIIPSMFSAVSSNLQVIRDHKITFLQGLGSEILMQLDPEPSTGRSNITVTVSDGLAQASQTFSLDLTFIVGLEDSGSGGMQAFPNPFTDKLSVKSSAQAGSIVTAALRDLFGKEVVRTQAHQSGVDLSTDRLAPGVYVLEVVCADGHLIRRRVIKR